MKGLLLRQDQVVANWAYKKFNLHPVPCDRGLGVLDKDGKLIGACLFQNFNGMNIDLSYYGPKTLTSGIVRYIAQVAALEFNVARLTVVTSQRNKRLIRALLKIGFRLEGVQRRFYGRHDNKRNAGVRLVVFRERIDVVAKIPEQKIS